MSAELTRLRLLAGSLAPGALIVAIRISKSYPWASAVLASLGMVAVVSTLVLLARRSAIPEQPFTLLKVSDKNDQVPTYLLTFVFPFLFLQAGGAREVIAYVAAGLFAALLVSRTSLLVANPILLAAGYGLYEVETTSRGGTDLILSSKKPIEGQTVGAVPIFGRIMKVTSIHP